jgi:hypothetical protein
LAHPITIPKAKSTTQKLETLPTLVIVLVSSNT